VETAPRKTTKNTVKHCDGSVGSMVANHRDGVESSVVVTTLDITYYSMCGTAGLLKLNQNRPVDQNQTSTYRLSVLFLSNARQCCTMSLARGKTQ